MSRAGPPLAAALALTLLLSSVPARANPSLSYDFNNMTQWLSDQLAQGLAFNAGENFDPPTLVKGYYLQPDVSLGVGIVPLSKTTFPALTNPELTEIGGASLFPNSVAFPNLAVHFRMGLPGNNDLYVRLADATTPPGYKISPTMTAEVQTNSIGFGFRHHFVSDDGWPTLVCGLHYNYVYGHVNLAGTYPVNIVAGYNDTENLTGTISWALHSFGTDAILYKTFGRWTPYGGLGYNYATGSVQTNLNLTSPDFLITPATGDGSDKPEANQGRAIAGTQYAFTSLTVFGGGEIKTIGAGPFKDYIAQVGAALPFEIGCGKTFFCRKNKNGAVPQARERETEDDDRWPASAPAPQPQPRPDPAAAPRMQPPPKDVQSPGMIFWQ